MKKLTLLIGTLFVSGSLMAAEPAYWMKQYPNAPQAKVDQCLAEAQAVYEKKLGGNMEGHFWAVLHKGNAWEKCMEEKK